jgi:molybdate transport repressor ModE-like protein
MGTLMNREPFEVPPPWEQLMTWLAVVETGSVSGAARRLGVSQASASQHVRLLESFYEVELLDRSTRPGRPTASGQRLMEYALRLLNQADEMAHGVRAFHRSKRPVVRIGCIDSVAATIGPQLVRGLSDKAYKVRLYSGLTPALASQFVNRQVDLLISTGDAGNAALTVRRELMSEQHFVALPRNFALSPSGSLTDLAQQLQFMHYSARSVMGRHIENYLQSTDPRIERAFEFDATDPMLALVAAGMGFALTTPLCLWQSRHHASQVQLYPLTDFTRAGKSYAPLWRSFFLSSQQGELGELPDEAAQIVRVATRVLKRDMLATLRLQDDALVIQGEH